MNGFKQHSNQPPTRRPPWPGAGDALEFDLPAPPGAIREYDTAAPFRAYLANLSALPESLISRFLNEPDTAALAVLCRSLGLTRDGFEMLTLCCAPTLGPLCLAPASALFDALSRRPGGAHRRPLARLQSGRRRAGLFSPPRAAPRRLIPAATPDPNRLFGQRQAQLGAAKSVHGIAAPDHHFADRRRDLDARQAARKRLLADMRMQQDPHRQQRAVRRQHLPALGIMFPAGIVMAQGDAEAEAAVGAPAHLGAQHIRLPGPKRGAQGEARQQAGK